MSDFREAIHHPRLVELYDYWSRIRGDRPMPARGDMDPLDIPHLLQNLLLLGVEYEPLRFYVRVYGTALAALRGRDITGQYLDEPGVSLISELLEHANRHVVDTKRPHAIEAPYPVSTERSGFFRRLALPFSEDGARVDMILIGFYQEFDTLYENDTGY